MSSSIGVRWAVQWRALARNSGWLLGEKAIRLVIGQAVVTALLARYLGPVEFGTFQFAVALVGLVAPLAGLGLEELTIRELVRRTSVEQESVMAGVVRLRMAGAAMAVLISLALAWSLRPGERDVLLLVLLLASGLIFNPAEAVDGWFQARGEFGPPVVVRLGAFLTGAGIKVGLIMVEAPLWCIAGATAVEAALAGVALAIAGRRVGCAWSERSAGQEQMWGLLKEGVPLLVSGFLVVLTMQVDKVLVALLAGDEQAGLFAGAARVTELLFALPMAFGAAVVPGLARLRASDQGSYWRLTRRISLVLISAAILLATGVAWQAEMAVTRLFGPAFLASAPVLQVHVFSFVFVCLVSLRGRVLVIEGRAHWVLWLAPFAAGANVALNLWLVPHHGAMGAAWAATLSWGFSALLAPVFFSPMRSMLREFLGVKKS